MVSRRALKRFYEHEGREAGQEDVFYRADSPEAWRHKLRKYWTQKLLTMRRTDSFLEIGCGDGVFVREAAPFCRKAVGVDISRERIRKAKARTNQKNVFFKVGAAEKLPAEKYDVILCAELLEHLPRPEACLDEIAKHCRREAVITVPGALNPLTRLLMKAVGRTFEDSAFQREGHLRHVSPEWLVREMQKRGFILTKKVNVGCLYCFPFGYYGTVTWRQVNKISHGLFKALSKPVIYLDERLDGKNILGWTAGVWAFNFAKR